MMPSSHPSLHDLYLLSRRFLENHVQAYQRQVLSGFSNARLSILIGQRGVGKTTFIIQQLLNAVDHDVLSPKILYVPTDHFLIGKTLWFFGFLY